jgi:O-antigen biosynthesis protein
LNGIWATSGGGDGGHDQLFMSKGDKITVWIIGRDMSELRLDSPASQGEEREFQVVNTPDDHTLQAVLTQWDPNVIVTFGDWAGHRLLAGANLSVRRRWINLDLDVEPSIVAQAALVCYTSTVFLTADESRNEPLISVWTPCFQPGAKLFRPLQSLLDQTYSNWEWIIVNDSDDAGVTWGLLQELARMDHRIKPWQPARRSGRIGELKRWACGLAQGELLVELDHDDELTDGCLDALRQSLVANPRASMFYTDGAEVIEDTLESVEYPPGWAFGYGSYRKEIYKGREYSVAQTPPLNEQTVRHIVGMPNHVRAWRRSEYFRLGGHNPNLHVADDYDLMVRSFLRGQMVHVPIFGYIQYRNRTGNTTFFRNAEIQRLVRLIAAHYEPEIQEHFSRVTT